MELVLLLYPYHTSSLYLSFVSEVFADVSEWIWLVREEMSTLCWLVLLSCSCWWWACNGMVWYGIIWYGMVWYGMALLLNSLMKQTICSLHAYTYTPVYLQFADLCIVYGRCLLQFRRMLWLQWCHDVGMLGPLTHYVHVQLTHSLRVEVSEWVIRWSSKVNVDGLIKDIHTLLSDWIVVDVSFVIRDISDRRPFISSCVL